MKQVKRTGNRLLKPREAVAAARRWIEERRLGEMPKTALLARKAVGADPAVEGSCHWSASASGRIRGTAPQSHYYIVPFAEAERPLARVCVLVNGYTARSKR